MAKELDVPIITLSQLSRATEQRKDDNKPKLSDLRESGAIEQDADMVLFIHKPQDANDKFVHPDDRGLFNGALEATGQQYVALDVALRLSDRLISLPTVLDLE